MENSPGVSQAGKGYVGVTLSESPFFHDNSFKSTTEEHNDLRTCWSCTILGISPGRPSKGSKRNKLYSHLVLSRGIAKQNWASPRDRSHPPHSWQQLLVPIINQWSQNCHLGPTSPCHERMSPPCAQPGPRSDHQSLLSALISQNKLILLDSEDS